MKHRSSKDNTNAAFRIRLAGGGMAEYLLIIFLVGFAALGAVRHFGKVARAQTGNMAKELAGKKADLGSGSGSSGPDAPSNGGMPGNSGGSPGTGNGAGGDTGSGGGGGSSQGGGGDNSGGGDGGSNPDGGSGGVDSGNQCTEAWRVDDDFLAVSEGRLITSGYVPTYTHDVKNKDGKVVHKAGDVMGVSGVTISTGVDLGQQSKSGTRSVIDDYVDEQAGGKNGKYDKKFVDTLMKKLDPYFGLHKKDAVDALEKTPLNVTSDEASLLANAFGYHTQKSAAELFDENNKKNMTFKSLPEEAQTVIVDFSYQYGMSDSRGTVRSGFWNHVYNGEWKELADWLNGGPDGYPNRRGREGKRLQQGISNDSLPESGNPCGPSGAPGDAQE